VKPSRAVDDRPEARRPVEAVADEAARSAAVDDDLHPIAVMLDLVDPAVARRRLLDEGREERGLACRRASWLA